MTWREKLERIRQAARETPELAMVFSDARGADDEFVEGLRREFAFLEVDYLEFLRSSDGIQLDMFVLFGSGKSSFVSIAHERLFWTPIFGNECLPIGEYPGGDCIMFSKDGKIRVVTCQMDQVSDGRVLAESFSQFLSDVLMGPMYPRLFDGLPPGYDNQWMAFLRQQGWL